MYSLDQHHEDNKQEIFSLVRLDINYLSRNRSFYKKLGSGAPIRFFAVQVNRLSATGTYIANRLADIKSG